jgi:hypothetical protein
MEEYFDNDSSEMILRAHEIPELKGFLGPLPDIQIIPLNIPGMKTAEGKNQKALSMGVSVPSKYRSLLKSILQTVSEDMKVEYVDFTMKYSTESLCLICIAWKEKKWRLAPKNLWRFHQ